MKLRTSLLVLGTTLVLGACDDSTSSPVTPGGGGGTVAFGSVAIGTWTGDTLVPVSASGVRDTPTVRITTRILADSSFSGDVRLLDLLGSNVEGPLYTRMGKWSILGDSAIVLAATTCQQSDTIATALGIALPFSFSTFQANPLKPVACGAPDTVHVRPSGNHWRIPLVVNMPGIATGSWNIDFVR